MSIRIEFHLPDDNVTPGNLAVHMGALGFFRHDDKPVQAGTVDPAEVAEKAATALNTEPTETVKGAEIEPAATLDTRPVGSPSEGNKRRNSAEKSADDELEALAAAKGVPLDKLNGVIAEHGRAIAEAELDRMAAPEETPAISTGENRVGPEDDPETEALDAADEKAEAEAVREPGSVTHDDLRHAVGRYQKVHGMPAAVALVKEGGLIGCTIDKVAEADLPAVIAKVEAACEAEQTAAEPEVEQANEPKLSRADVQKLMEQYMATYGADAVQQDGPKIFKSALGEVPAGTKNAKGVEVSAWVLSAIPDDQESLKKCVSWWKSAITQAPKAFGRKAVS